MAANAADWYKECEICAQYRGATMRPPMSSIYAKDEYSDTLPWEDVIIDVQGPFTRSEDGMQYILSYHCSRLRVPLLFAFKSLQAAHFGRALITCVLRARILPLILRSDRGPEMRRAEMDVGDEMYDEEMSR